jgi:acetate kinase
MDILVCETSGMANVLAINGGSSSVRFALYAGEHGMPLQCHGAIERLGTPDPRLKLWPSPDATPIETDLAAADHGSAIDVLFERCEQLPAFAALGAVGHRIVNGGRHTDPERVTPEFLADLRRIAPFDPEHLPREIALIEGVARRHPNLPQVACFDTAFHRNMPRVAKLLPIPRRYAEQGVLRTGFHGLSYQYLLGALVRGGEPAATRGRLVLAHLGSGASLAAVRDGVSVDTTMGFTPAAGLVMSTRTGDLDPGLPGYLARTEHMSADRFTTMINHESGLLGISETSADVRDLLAREAEDVRAAEALALFCYQAKKWLGAYAAVLGGLDALVFAGGIGENSPALRARICAGLEFLGLELDSAANDRGAALISAGHSRVRVRVLHTDEEQIVAEQTLQLLDLR